MPPTEEGIRDLTMSPPLTLVVSFLEESRLPCSFCGSLLLLGLITDHPHFLARIHFSTLLDKHI